MILGYILIFVFGACIGSFLNCVVLRMEKGKKFTNGRSVCLKCKHKLAWYDLIPIFSFLALMGKCRYCHKKIAMQYLIVEIATGILFLLIYNFTGLGLNLIYLLAIACLLEIIFIYDLRNYIIPDKFVFSAIGLSLIYQLFFGHSSLAYLGLSVAVSAGFFFLIWAVSQGKWMGFGDVKLALFMGLFLSWPNILVALFFAFIFGSVVGLILIGLKKKKLQSQVPFGPFLITGTFIALFWGERIINWYLILLG